MTSVNLADYQRRELAIEAINLMKGQVDRTTHIHKGLQIALELIGEHESQFQEGLEAGEDLEKNRRMKNEVSN